MSRAKAKSKGDVDELTASLVVRVAAKVLQVATLSVVPPHLLMKVSHWERKQRMGRERDQFMSDSPTRPRKRETNDEFEDDLNGFKWKVCQGGAFGNEEGVLNSSRTYLRVEGLSVVEVDEISGLERAADGRETSARTRTTYWEHEG